MRFGGSFGAQAMVGGRRGDAPRPHLGGEQKQGHAVGSAGDGKAQPLAGRDQRVEVAAETLNLLMLPGHAAPLSTSAALRLRLGVVDLLPEVGAHLGAVNGVEFLVSLASLRDLPELRQRLSQIIEAVGRPLALRVVAIIGEQRLCGGARLALVEQSPADEVVGVADPAVLGICRDEGLKVGDRIVILAGFPLPKALRVGVLAGVVAAAASLPESPAEALVVGAGFAEFALGSPLPGTALPGLAAGGAAVSPATGADGAAAAASFIRCSSVDSRCS